jgi:hypothetical protein
LYERTVVSSTVTDRYLGGSATSCLGESRKECEPNSDACYYLGDRYWRLADCYRERGASGKARELQAKAEWYLRESGWWNGGPYAAAMAMPAPKRPTFTAAIGWRSRQGPPDDAA